MHQYKRILSFLYAIHREVDPYSFRLSFGSPILRINSPHDRSVIQLIDYPIDI